MFGKPKALSAAMLKAKLKDLYRCPYPFQTVPWGSMVLL